MHFKANPIRSGDGFGFSPAARKRNLPKTSASRPNPIALLFLIWAKTRSYPKAYAAICVNGWAVMPLQAVASLIWKSTITVSLNNIFRL